MRSRLAAHGVNSPSAALTDIYEVKRPWLDQVKHAIRPHEGQVGAVVEVDGRPLALDLVSRHDVFADLLARLVDGYALLAGTPRAAGVGSSHTAALAFYEKTMSSRSRWLPTPGMGDAFALTRRSIHGSGLRAEGELIALSAFPAVG